MRLRTADPDRDGAACAAIYAPAVLGTTSFEKIPPDATEMGARIRQTLERWPWLVADTEDGVVGYAYAGAHRSREGYRWATEVSVYVAAAHHRHGLGRALLELLLADLTAQDFLVALAGIALPNPASVGLHERLGFQVVGTYRGIGYTAGRLCDVGWWQRSLSEVPEGPPPSPRPPRRLG